MRVLGIDPGMARLGWSVLESSSHGGSLVRYGCIETSSNQFLTERLTQIYAKLNQLMNEVQPDSLAIETLFFVKNAKTLAQVGHVRGVILLAAGPRGLSVFGYASRQNKNGV